MNNAQRDRILKMLEDGKITAEEAARLLDAVGADTAEENAPAEQPAAPAPEPQKAARNRKLRVVVDAAGDAKEKAKVNVAVPLSLIRTVGPLVAHNMPEKARQELEEKGVDLERILSEVEHALDEGLEEDIVNIDAGDDEDGTRVRVYVE